MHQTQIYIHVSSLIRYTFIGPHECCAHIPYTNLIAN